MSDLYDRAFVINLDRSLRFKKVKTKLDESKIEFERFSAIDGNNIYATNSQSNLTLSGEFLKNHTMRVGKTKHQINCNNDSDNPIRFELYNPQTSGWVPGEIGLWCSNIAIWRAAKKEGFKHIVIFEDDINIKKPATLNHLINSFIGELPDDYDIAFLSVLGNTKHHMKVPGTKCVMQVQNRTWQYEYGSHAVVYSQRAIDKLLSVTLIDNALDAYFFNHNVGNGAYDDMHFLEVYTSCHKSFLAPLAGTVSEMGRYNAQELE